MGPLLAPILGNPILRTRALHAIDKFALGQIDDRAIQIHRLVQRLLRADLDPEQTQVYAGEAQMLLAAASRIQPEDETRPTGASSAGSCPISTPSAPLPPRRAGCAISPWHAKKYGEDDPRTLRTVNNLALGYALVSDYDKAVELQSRVNEVRSRPGVGSKLDLLVSWGGLCQAVRLNGDYQAAYDLGVEALDYGRSEVGVDHVHTLAVAVDLAIAMRRLGRIEDAHALHGATLILYDRTLGIRHPDTVLARSGGRLDFASIPPRF
ncbi:tetratricopeptide repeat protein [Microbispora rosea]|uniref:tetratricopeptide repeat protein n=1 Tax=Microbispora rosea TaxID=58117 RepID=UPI00343B9004